MLGLWQGPAVGCHKAAARCFRSAEQSASAVFLTRETEEVCPGQFWPYVISVLYFYLWGKNVFSLMGAMVYVPTPPVAHQMFQQWCDTKEVKTEKMKERSPIVSLANLDGTVMQPVSLFSLYCDSWLACCQRVWPVSLLSCSSVPFAWDSMMLD